MLANDTKHGIGWRWQHNTCDREDTFLSNGCTDDLAQWNLKILTTTTKKSDPFSIYRCTVLFNLGLPYVLKLLDECSISQ